MLKKVNDFLNIKNVEEDIINGIGYVCQGGSHIFGTNNENSDMDLRGVILPVEDYVLGLKEFDHLKFSEGSNNINLKDDMDVEFFSFKHFIKGLYNGHGIPLEMFFVDEKFILSKDNRLKDLFENKDLFISKSIAFHYLAMNKQFEYKIDIPVGNIRNPLSIERIEKYGYETKNASKAVQHLRVVLHLLLKNELNFYREDRTELLNIKEGKVDLKLVKEEIEVTRKEIESLLKTSILPKKPDFEKVNFLYKKIIKELI
jgi:hypothetical protein